MQRTSCLSWILLLCCVVLCLENVRVCVFFGGLQTCRAANTVAPRNRKSTAFDHTQLDGGEVVRINFPQSLPPFEGA